MSVSLVEETGVPGGNHRPTDKLSHILPVASLAKTEDGVNLGGKDGEGGAAWANPPPPPHTLLSLDPLFKVDIFSALITI